MIDNTDYEVEYVCTKCGCITEVYDDSIRVFPKMGGNGPLGDIAYNNNKTQIFNNLTKSACPMCQKWVVDNRGNTCSEKGW